MVIIVIVIHYTPCTMAQYWAKAMYLSYISQTAMTLYLVLNECIIIVSKI